MQDRTRLILGGFGIVLFCGMMYGIGSNIFHNRTTFVITYYVVISVLMVGSIVFIIFHIWKRCRNVPLNSLSNAAENYDRIDTIESVDVTEV